MNIAIHELKQLLEAAASAAVDKYIAATKPGDDIVTQKWAFEQYGRKRVLSWIDKGLLKQIGRSGTASNSKRLYSRAELACVERAARIEGLLLKR